MSKDDYYRKLAAANLRIAEGRDRLEAQKNRVLAGADQPSCHQDVVVLRAFERSLRLMIRSRAVLIERLMKWPEPR